MQSDLSNIEEKKPITKTAQRPKTARYTTAKRLERPVKLTDLTKTVMNFLEYGQAKQLCETKPITRPESGNRNQSARLKSSGKVLVKPLVWIKPTIQTENFQSYEKIKPTIFSPLNSGKSTDRPFSGSINAAKIYLNTGQTWQRLQKFKKPTRNYQRPSQELRSY